MAWAYDNDLGAPLRTLVRNAVVTLLAPLKKPTGFLERVIPLGYSVDGKHDGSGIDLLWSDLRGALPAIAVATTMGKDEPAGAPDRSRCVLDVELYFVTSHMRDMTDGRIFADPAAALSNSNDPGLDAMLELAWQLCFNAELGIGSGGRKRVTPLVRIAEEPIASTQEFTMWRQHYQTKLTLDVDMNRGVVQAFTNAHTKLFQTPDLLAYLKFASYTTHVDTIITAKATRGYKLTVQTIPRLTGLSPWVTYAENVGAGTITLTYEKGVAKVSDLELALAASTLVSVSTPGTQNNVMQDPADTLAATHLTDPKSTIIDDRTIG